jgi:hypothetical protein
MSRRVLWCAAVLVLSLSRSPLCDPTTSCNCATAYPITDRNREGKRSWSSRNPHRSTHKLGFARHAVKIFQRPLTGRQPRNGGGLRIDGAAQLALSLVDAGQRGSDLAEARSGLDAQVVQRRLLRPRQRFISFV